MSLPLDQISSISEKVKQLLKQYAVLQKENNDLREEIQSLQNTIKEKNAAVQQVQNQVSAMQLNTAGGLSKEDKGELTKKIDAYIREIDRCIALLGSS